VAYWLAGLPTLASASGQVTLSAEAIPLTAVGRIALGPDRAAYSYYDSPLDFVEATVVELDGDTPLTPERVAIGPSEVLDLRGDRLLLGRPRAEEREPSGELWVVDLDLGGSTP
jgi:hypothetical protein